MWNICDITIEPKISVSFLGRNIFDRRPIRVSFFKDPMNTFCKDHQW